MANWLVEGLTATISGVLTVFIVLILIAFLIGQLKHLNRLNLLQSSKKDPRNTLTAKSVHVVRSSENKEQQVYDDLEMVAVITAAVAASMNTTTDKLVVRSIRRVDSGRRRR